MPLMVQGAGRGLAASGATGAPATCSGRAPARLDIGLVNLMPDAALKATERQFARLLAAASGPTDVRLHLFSLAEVPRGAAALASMDGRYGDLAALEGTRLDGLIVTGTEPLASSLTDEPYWTALTRVIDWAEQNTASTIFSCLAAHAAVLHLDGIARRRLTQKRSGLFACVRTSAGGLLAGAPTSMRVPHSRWNDLDEDDLRSHGYEILSRSAEVGIDVFTKQWASLFVFLQGHPEYDGDTLFREFRRDLRRFIDGERDDPPALPTDYFDDSTERRLTLFRDDALRSRDRADWGAFPREWTARPALLEAWRETSDRFVGNWLSRLAELTS